MRYTNVVVAVPVTVGSGGAVAAAVANSASAVAAVVVGDGAVCYLNRLYHMCAEFSL